MKKRLAEMAESGYPKRDRFKPGERVLTKAGPLRDLEAIFDRSLSPSDRVRVLVDVLGRLTPCVIRIDCLEKVGRRLRWQWLWVCCSRVQLELCAIADVWDRVSVGTAEPVEGIEHMFDELGLRKSKQMDLARDRRRWRWAGDVSRGEGNWTLIAVHLRKGIDALSRVKSSGAGGQTP